MDFGNELRKSSSKDSKILYYIQTGVQASEQTHPYAITIKFKAPFVIAEEDEEGEEITSIDYEGFKSVNEYGLLKNA